MRSGTFSPVGEELASNFGNDERSLAPRRAHRPRQTGSRSRSNCRAPVIATDISRAIMYIIPKVCILYIRERVHLYRYDMVEKGRYRFEDKWEPIFRSPLILCVPTKNEIHRATGVILARHTRIISQKKHFSSISFGIR